MINGTGQKMSFNAIQNGVIRTLTTHADYSCNNVFADDFRGLGAGNAVYVVISLGGLSYDDFTFQKVQNSWLVNLDIYTIKTGEIATSVDNAHNNMQSVIDTLNQYPFLNDTTGVVDHNVVVISPIELTDPLNGNRNAYLHQQIGLSVSEICQVTRAEP